jgi:hypothetical protein
MAIFDAENLFSDEQAITATAASTNVIDTGDTKDVGKGAPLRIYGRVMEAFNTLTSLTVAIQTATDAAFTSAVTLSSKSIVLANLDAIGDLVINDVIPQGALRYLRLYYTVVGTDPTTGEITAGIVFDSQTNP